jgi:hypothetical protein
MRDKAIFVGSQSTASRPYTSLLSFTLCTVLSAILPILSGCSWHEFFAPDIPAMSNAAAVDRALQLCALTHGDRPFHLILEISPPAPSKSGTQIPASLHADMRAQIEIHWLNAITYRTVIHSQKFSQTRVVNGGVVEEHNTGDFYPRWIQNFVDALLDPVPKAAALRKLPGSVPISRQSHACISNSSDELSSSQVCFQDEEPRLASGIDFTRYVSFDDFEPFGSQQIPRTLINDLPANFLVRGHITLLEPLPQSTYRLLKAREFTQPGQQIRTTLVSKSAAQSMLQSMPDSDLFRAYAREHTRLVSYTPPDNDPKSNQAAPQGPITVYIRTDRTGRVREVYRDSADIYGLHSAAVTRALAYKFKPLLVNGAPQQMEAPLELP